MDQRNLNNASRRFNIDQHQVLVDLAKLCLAYADKKKEAHAKHFKLKTELTEDEMISVVSARSKNFVDYGYLKWLRENMVEFECYALKSFCGVALHSNKEEVEDLTKEELPKVEATDAAQVIINVLELETRKTNELCLAAKGKNLAYLNIKKGVINELMQSIKDAFDKMEDVQ